MPNAEYRLTPKARDDLAAIHAHGCAEWGRAQADRHVEGLAATFALLADFPAMAPLRAEFAPPMRIHPHGPHLILYIEQGGVVVVRILHGRQDILAALDG